MEITQGKMAQKPKSDIPRRQKRRKFAKKSNHSPRNGFTKEPNLLIFNDL
jgi:hypothetical protein